MASENIRVEEFHLDGEAVVSKVKALVREGNIRRIALQTADGTTLFESPLTADVVGAAFLPRWAALGAVAALAAQLTITVERNDTHEK